MGSSYLIDSNVAIDLVAGRLPQRGAEWLDDAINKQLIYTSVINQIELLGFNGSERELRILKDLLKAISILSLNDTVVARTIALRREVKIKLPDAIIAATTLVHDLSLVTRNIKDFGKINNLRLVDPYRASFPKISR